MDYEGVKYNLAIALVLLCVYCSMVEWASFVFHSRLCQKPKLASGQLCQTLNLANKELRGLCGCMLWGLCDTSWTIATRKSHLTPFHKKQLPYLAFTGGLNLRCDRDIVQNALSYLRNVTIYFMWKPFVISSKLLTKNRQMWTKVNHEVYKPVNCKW